MATLTNANSVIMLAVAGIFPTPQQLQGYATDDMFTAADVAPAEVVMGVDGKLSGGYTPYPVALEITLQADSPSMVVFDTWEAFQRTAREVFVAEASVKLPGTSQKWALTRGFLTGYSPMPAGRRILQPRKFTVTFESCTQAPF